MNKISPKCIRSFIGHGSKVKEIDGVCWEKDERRLNDNHRTSAIHWVQSIYNFYEIQQLWRSLWRCSVAPARSNVILIFDATHDDPVNQRSSAIQLVSLAPSTIKCVRLFSPTRLTDSLVGLKNEPMLLLELRKEIRAICVDRTNVPSELEPNTLQIAH